MTENKRFAADPGFLDDKHAVMTPAFRAHFEAVVENGAETGLDIQPAPTVGGCNVNNPGSFKGTEAA